MSTLFLTIIVLGPFIIATLAIVISIIVPIIIHQTQKRKKINDFECSNCKSNEIISECKGSEFLGWIMYFFGFVVVGIIYFMFRSSTRHQVCGNCNSKEIVKKQEQVKVETLDNEDSQPNSNENLELKEEKVEEGDPWFVGMCVVFGFIFVMILSVYFS